MNRSILSAITLTAMSSIAVAHEQANTHLHDYTVAAVGAVALAVVTFFVLKFKRDQEL